MSYKFQQLRDDEFQKLWDERMAETTARVEATKDQPASTNKERLEAARAAYFEFDENFAPGGVFEKASAAQKFEQEKLLYKHHGDRPAPKTAKEAVEEEREAQIRGSAEMANELERWTAQMLEDGGYASIEAARKGERQPIPSLITNDEGVRGYMAEDGRVVPEYIVISNKPAFNPEFTKLHEHAERLKKLAGI